MKKIILILLLFISVAGYSQSDNYLPNSKNELSQYFKKEIPKKKLKKVLYPKGSYSIILYFKINEFKEYYNIEMFGNPELKELVVKLLKKYPLEKLNLGTISTHKEYYFQLLSKIKGKTIFNCSNAILSKTLPVLGSCNDLMYYGDQNRCTKDEIKKYLYQNIDFSRVNRLSGDKNITISLDLSVNKKGKLVLKSGKFLKVLKKSIEKSIDTFPEFIKPATVNDVVSSYSFKTLKIKFKQGETPKFRERYASFDEYAKPTTSNDFAKYMASNLTEEDMKRAFLNRISSKLILYFQLDKNNVPFEMSTNINTPQLRDKIKTLFKKYDIKKLNFYNTKSFNKYSLQILSFTDGKTIVSTNSTVLNQRIPLYSKCKKSSKNIKEAKKCFSRIVQTHFSRRFDTDLPNKLNLRKGDLRIFINFEINSDGKVDEIYVKTPHPKIREEVVRVMSKLPKVDELGEQNKTFVSIKYSIPFTLVVD